MKLKARIENSFLFIVLTLVVIINIVLAIDNAQLKGSLKEFLNPIKPRNYERESGITEDEVMVVVTGEKGLWDNQNKPRIELTYELTIGRENSEIFYRVFPVKSDRIGNIYVGEMAEGTIRKFDPKGNHLLNIGKKGQGPGEFLGPFNFVFESDTILTVFDTGTQRMTRFSQEGVYLNSTQLELKGVQLPTFLRGCAVDAQGFYYLSYYNYELNKIIHKFSKEGVIVNSFGEPFDTNNPSGFSAFYVKHSNAPGVLANLDESLFFSQANPYEIRKYSLDGKLKIKVVRKNSFMAPQKMEMTQGRFTIKVPVNSTTIGVWQNMLINCVGFPPHTNHNKKTVIDFFSMEGQLLTSLTLEERVFFSYIDHRGKVYGVKFDDNLEESIVKYALKVRQE